MLIFKPPSTCCKELIKWKDVFASSAHAPIAGQRLDIRIGVDFQSGHKRRLAGNGFYEEPFLFIVGNLAQGDVFIREYEQRRAVPIKQTFQQLDRRLRKFALIELFI